MRLQLYFRFIGLSFEVGLIIPLICAFVKNYFPRRVDLFGGSLIFPDNAFYQA